MSYKLLLALFLTYLLEVTVGGISYRQKRDVEDYEVATEVPADGGLPEYNANDLGSPEPADSGVSEPDLPEIPEPGPEPAEPGPQMPGNGIPYPDEPESEPDLTEIPEPRPEPVEPESEPDFPEIPEPRPEPVEPESEPESEPEISEPGPEPAGPEGGDSTDTGIFRQMCSSWDEDEEEEVHCSVLKRRGDGAFLCTRKGYAEISARECCKTCAEILGL